MSERKPKPDQSISPAQAAVNRALELIGTKWVHQGRVPGAGLDCIGLAIECATAAGIKVQDVSGYGRVEPPEVIMENVMKYCVEVPRSEAQPGDILVMRWRDIPQHLGIYTGDNWMIHSYEKEGVVAQQLIPFWEKRIVGVFRIIQ